MWAETRAADNLPEHVSLPITDVELLRFPTQLMNRLNSPGDRIGDKGDGTAVEGSAANENDGEPASHTLGKVQTAVDRIVAGVAIALFVKNGFTRFLVMNAYNKRRNTFDKLSKEMKFVGLYEPITNTKIPDSTKRQTLLEMIEDDLEQEEIYV